MRKLFGSLAMTVVLAACGKDILAPVPAATRAEAIAPAAVTAYPTDQTCENGQGIPKQGVCGLADPAVSIASAAPRPTSPPHDRTSCSVVTNDRNNAFTSR